MRKGQTIPAIDRFWPKVAVGEPDECWEWQASLNPRGYGQFKRTPGQPMMGAHRFSWEIANRQPIPQGMFVCHSCDNPACVNPNHLWLGTAKDNRIDCSRKGRIPKQKPSLRAFTDNEITELRKIFQCSGKSYGAIARAYQLGSAMTIWQAINGKRYSHVPYVDYGLQRPSRKFTCQACNGVGCDHCEHGISSSQNRGRWLNLKRKKARELSEYERLERKTESGSVLAYVERLE